MIYDIKITIYDMIDVRKIMNQFLMNNSMFYTILLGLESLSMKRCNIWQLFSKIYNRFRTSVRSFSLRHGYNDLGRVIGNWEIQTGILFLLRISSE